MVVLSACLGARLIPVAGLQTAQPDGLRAGCVMRCDASGAESSVVDRDLVDLVVPVGVSLADLKVLRIRVVREMDRGRALKRAVDVPTDVRPVVRNDEMPEASRQGAAS